MSPEGWSPQQVSLRDDGIDVRIFPRPTTVVDSFRHPAHQRLARPGDGAFPL